LGASLNAIVTRLYTLGSDSLFNQHWFPWNQPFQNAILSFHYHKLYPHQTITVSGQLPPGKVPPRTTVAAQLPPGQLPPRTTATQNNCHPDNCYLGQLPPRTTATQDNCHSGQLPLRTTATWDNCHSGQLPPGTTATRTAAIPWVLWGGNMFPHFFHVFLCSAMKVNTSLKTDSNISLKCSWKSLVFHVRFHTSFSAPHPVLLGQHPPRILRFTYHIQAIKFSFVYRVATRKGPLAAKRLRTSGCYYNIASAYFRKSELQRCCCCHLTHKSKAKVK